MASPKRKQALGRSRRRRSHNAIKRVQLHNCSNCQTPIPTHVVCPNCGNYNGRVVVQHEE